MGRPKHFCEKPQDPYLQYVVTTTTTSTTLAPFESYIKYPSYSGCVEFCFDSLPYNEEQQDQEILGACITPTSNPSLFSCFIVAKELCTQGTWYEGLTCSEAMEALGLP